MEKGGDSPPLEKLQRYVLESPNLFPLVNNLYSFSPQGSQNQKNQI